MFQVKDIWDEAGLIVGNCNEVRRFSWLSDAVTLIANKGDFEGWKGFIDICTTGEGRCISLPREVGAVEAVNIGGRPTLGLGQLFNFHLNGPGDCHQSCRWTWQDKGGFYATYRDITVPSRVVAYLQNPDDNGAETIIFGYDDNGNRLQRETSAGILDGYQVPTIYGYALPEDGAPIIARIQGVSKALTKGSIRLSTIDDDGATGTLLSVMEPDETLPQYRRITLGRACPWVRVAYRKTNPVFSSQFDRVPLKSRIGFLLAVRAVKAYADSDIAKAHAFEADAARLELEAQNAMESPTFSPIQVVNGNNLQDTSDVDIR